MPKKEKKSEKKDVKKTSKKKVTAVKPAAKKAPAKKAPPRKPVAARTRASAATPARIITRRRGGKSEVVGVIGTVTSEEIALKAYYLAEQRRNLGLPSNPEADWLEAERLLRG